MSAKQAKRAKTLTRAERSTRAWNAGCLHAFRKGSEFYSRWLHKYAYLYHLPEWPEELLIAVESRYGLR